MNVNICQHGNAKLRAQSGGLWYIHSHISLFVHPPSSSVIHSHMWLWCAGFGQVQINQKMENKLMWG